MRHFNDRFWGGGERLPSTVPLLDKLATYCITHIKAKLPGRIAPLTDSATDQNIQDQWNDLEE